jgi:hypothetical protein
MGGHVCWVHLLAASSVGWEICQDASRQLRALLCPADGVLVSDCVAACRTSACMRLCLRAVALLSVDGALGRQLQASSRGHITVPRD